MSKFLKQHRSAFYSGPLVFLAMLLALVNAQAASFSVSPTQIFLNSDNLSTQLTITNASRETVTLSVSAFAWHDLANGQADLKTSDSILVFPAIFTLLPLQQQILRVGITAAARPIEQTFRVVVNELPPSQIAVTPRGANIRILTAFSVPVFLSPTAPRTDVTLTNPQLSSGKFGFDIANAGTVHVPPTSVRVTAKDAEGKALWTHTVTAWYVLAGDRRTISIAVPPAVCTGSRSFSVQMDAPDFHAAKAFDSVAGSCHS